MTEQDDAVKATEKLVSLYKELNTSLEDRRKAIKAELEILEEENNVFTSINRKVESQNQLFSLQREYEETLVSIAKQRLEQGIKLKDFKDGELEKLKETIVAGREQIKQSIEHDKSLALVEDRADSIFGIFANMQMNETFIGSIVEAVEKGASLADIGARIGNSFAKNINSGNLLTSMLGKVQEATIALAFAQDIAITSFNKATGAQGEYNDVITSVESNNRDLYLGIDNVANSAGALRVGFMGFRDMSKSSAAETIKLAAELENLGVDAGDTATNMNIATKALGMTDKQAVELQKELYATAIAMGEPPSKMAAGFAAAAPQLAAHGSKMVGVFKGLAGAARATGASVEELLGIVGQFDTFEGAADAAGHLNQVLGGDFVNSVELMMAKEDERVALLRRGIQESGKSWATMDRWDRKAAAQAAGIDDMTVAAKLFGATDAEFRKHTKEAENAAAAQAELEKRMGPVVDLQKQFTTLASEFAIQIEPGVKLLKDFISQFLILNKEMGGWAIPGVIGLIGVYKLLRIAHKKGIVQWVLTKAATVSDTAQKILNKFATKGVSEETEKLTGKQKGAGKAAGSAALSMLAFGAAVLMIGGGIAVAAYGMAQFVKAFNGMSPEQIYAVVVAIGIFMGGMILLVAVMLAMAPAAATAGGAFLLLGAGVALIGVGVLAAAYGMSLLVDSLGTAFLAINGNLMDFLAFTAGMSILSLLGAGLLLTFGVLVPGMAGLAISLALIKTADLQAMGQMFGGISSITAATASAMANIAISIASMVADLNRLDLDKLEALDKIIGTKVGPVGSAVPTRGSSSSSLAALGNAAPAQSYGARGASGGGDINLEIDLKLDGESLGKVIKKITAKQISEQLENVGRTKKRLGSSTVVTS